MNGFPETGFMRALGAALLVLWAACAHGADDKPDHCIVGDNAIGCISQAALSEIVDYSGSVKHLRSTIADKLASGACELFDYGERVYVTATEGSDRSSVRRPDESESYWMPSSWSRPASECRANASPELVDKKIGMPTPERIEPRFRQPTVITRDMLPPLPVARHCVFKSVMTDAEIRACRRTAREATPRTHGE